MKTSTTPPPQSSTPVHLSHTHSNAHGKVADYYAKPDITAKHDLPANTIDLPGAVHGLYNSIGWLTGCEMGVVK